jgi:hypothetical protein
MEITEENVRRTMLELEHEHGSDHANLDDVAARILGIEPGEEWTRALASETGRTGLLCANWYGVKVAVLPNQQAMAVAMVQGMTMAAAVWRLQGE